jgi:polysaccharide pyruvyl transferase WcaK-like protein
MKHSRKIGFLSAPLFSNNMGCNALTYGSIGILEAVAQGLGVSFEYCLAGNPAEAPLPPDLTVDRAQLVAGPQALTARRIVGGLCRRNITSLVHEQRPLSRSDIFVDNGNGDSFSDIYGIPCFRMIENRFKFALDRRKPLILLPQTIGPFKSQKAAAGAVKVLRGAAAVYARDPLSVQCARDLAGDVEVSETVDVALFMPYKKRAAVSTGTMTIGLNPSGLLWKGGYTQDNQFGLKDDYRSVVRTIIQALLKLKGVTVELIGHDIGGPNGGNLEDDYYVCKLLQKEFPSCRVAPFFYSPVEAKSYISGLDLLVGSRMHCCIAAYSSGVPTFPLAYSRKFRGLFVEKLGYACFSDLLTDDREQALAGLLHVLEGLDGLKAEMPGHLAQLAETREQLIENMSHALEGLM